MISTEQRDKARAYANEVRLYHANLKRDIAAGRQMVDELLLADPSTLDKRALTARAYTLVAAVPFLGPKRIDKAFGRAGIPPTKRLGDLTYRQRADLVAELDQIPAYQRQVAA